jgi:hypothetical protein
MAPAPRIRVRQDAFSGPRALRCSLPPAMLDRGGHYHSALRRPFELAPVIIRHVKHSGSGSIYLSRVSQLSVPHPSTSPPAHSGIPDGEVKQLERGIVVGEAAARFDDFAERRRNWAFDVLRPRG